MMSFMDDAQVKYEKSENKTFWDTKNKNVIAMNGIRQEKVVLQVNGQHHHRDYPIDMDGNLLFKKDPFSKLIVEFVSK